MIAVWGPLRGTGSLGTPGEPRATPTGISGAERCMWVRYGRRPRLGDVGPWALGLGRVGVAGMSLGTAAQLTNTGQGRTPGPEPSPSRKIVPNQCAQLGLPYRRTSHQNKTDFREMNKIMIIIMISSPPDDHLREISISLFVQFAVDQWREWNVADELAGKQARLLLACLLFC